MNRVERRRRRRLEVIDCRERAALRRHLKRGEWWRAAEIRFRRVRRSVPPVLATFAELQAAFDKVHAQTVQAWGGAVEVRHLVGRGKGAP